MSDAEKKDSKIPEDNHIYRLASLGQHMLEVDHEIQNSLAIINSNCAILKKVVNVGSYSFDLIAEQVKSIKSATDRISRVSKSLKSLSRDSSVSDLDHFTLSEVIEDIMGLLSLKIKNRCIDFSLLGDQSVLDESLYSSRSLLSQVIVNLFSNAFDAIELQLNPLIKLQVWNDEYAIYLSLEDNGPGVPLDMRERVFEPFFTTKKVGAGTGIGLNISRKIMSALGGDIYLDSKISSKFVIKILRHSGVIKE